MENKHEEGLYLYVEVSASEVHPWLITTLSIVVKLGPYST